MLHLLTLLLPPGKTSHFTGSADDDLRVQLYLDDGTGPAMVQVAVGRTLAYGDEPARGDTATVTVSHRPDNCRQSTSVVAEWPDGTVVQVDAASCLAGDGGPTRPTRPALTDAQAIRVAADPRWGVTMDPTLIEEGAARFGSVPVEAG